MLRLKHTQSAEHFSNNPIDLSDSKAFAEYVV